MKKIAILLMMFTVAASVSAQGLLNRPGVNRPGLMRGRMPNRVMPGAAGQEAAQQPSAAPAGAAGEAGAADPGGRSIEFNATPIDLVFKVYGELVNKTILKDPQVPSATITLQPRQGQELTDEDKIEAIEAVLEMNGVHMEPYGEKFMRALPRKEVRKEGIPLIMDPDHELGESTKVVSLMLPFKNIAIEDAQKALEGFKSASGILLVFERTNAILITDTEQNINRMREIAKAIDVANPVTEVVEYIQVKYANATEIKQVIDSIVEESQKEQEANGGKRNAPVQQQQQQQRPFGGSLLGRRPGQQQQQPAAPVNNESMFIGVSEADRGMIRGKVVTIADERSNKILIITSATNMKFFKEVIAALDVETTPDTVVKVYRLKYAEAEDVSDMINDLIGNSVSGKDSKGNQNQNAKKGTSGSVTRGNQAAAKKPANQRTGETQAGELNKDNTTVLADKRINGLVVMTDKELVPTIEQIIESMDIKLSQVLIETVIVEVTLGNGIETGMDWVQKGRQSVSTPTQVQNAMGQNMFYKQQTITTSDGQSSTKVLSDLVPSGFSRTTKTTDEESGITTTISETASDVAAMFSKNVVDRSGLANNWYGATRTALGGGSGGGINAFANAASNSLGKAFTFIFDSDELGLAAILQASETDSRTKYIASPIVMTLDNKEAVVNATRMKYLLKGFTSSGTSYSTIAVPDYEQKELGIELKITPKINPNGTVMLTVEEKYTQVGANQQIYYASGTGGEAQGGLQAVDVPTSITREMSADVLLENNQTVVFGGLTETQVSESETGIPFLKDIPIVGKWLFGSVQQSEDRVELLVFMTPYVLDDAQAAQVEAMRRKKTMSDPRPWEDHGWSLSPLADPVSKQEQMRRIKDEWKKQDEERRTKIAIEKMKVERAKALQEMSKEERDLWLKMHKKELDEEQREELEEKMLDKDSQEELKKLAEQVKAQKLGAADKAIKKAAEETAAENERGKLDAAKKAKEDAEKAPPAEKKTEAAPQPQPAEKGMLGELGQESK